LVAIFLGAWWVPGLNDPATASSSVGELWLGVGLFVVKTLITALVLLWIRRFLPRLRHDQVLRLCWVVLIPLATLGVFLSRWAVGALAL
jgi:NADH-quinone oxidoreductase subunit H